MESLITRASTFAGDIDQIIMVIAWIGGLGMLVAELILFYLIMRYRKEKNPKAQYITGEEKNQKRWISIPHGIVLFFDIIIIIMAIRVWVNVKQDLPPADETIGIVGHQWAWRFIHPGMDGKLGTADDVQMVDELHVKVDTTYHFKLESEDVLHSFSVPVFRLKQDAVPGRVITGWFKPTKTGQFDIQCTEMCGIGHGIMGAKLFIETKQNHEKWLQTVASAGT